MDNKGTNNKKFKKIEQKGNVGSLTCLYQAEKVSHEMVKVYLSRNVSISGVILVR